MKTTIGWFFRLQRANVLVALFFPLALFAQDDKVYTEFSGNVEGEYRYFQNEGLYENQKQSFPSLSIQPEYYLEWADGAHLINFTGFGRVDFTDDSRNHWDIRELYWQTVQDDWELSLGFKKVYWGVTEAVHLVDIINQTDALETFDGEQKLGQLMGHYSYIGGFGTLDLFVMSLFRERQFPGSKGRLRTPVPISDDDLEFESDQGRARPDFAARYSNSVGVFDLGLSYFYGTGREPIVVGIDQGTFSGIYPIIHQTGLDVQATTGPILWKVESVIRRSAIQDMWAVDAGLEYTFGNVGGSGLDIGLLGEYIYDDRGDLALSSLQSDLFLGGRLAFNDAQSTDILIGAIIDLERSTRLFSLEANRRIGNSLKATAEMRIFHNVSDEEFLYVFREDSFFKFNLGWYF